MLYITDLDGKKIEVTDLPEAIRQVEEFVSYLPDKANAEHLLMHDRLHHYWSDALQKLMELERQYQTIKP